MRKWPVCREQERQHRYCCNYHRHMRKHNISNALGTQVEVTTVALQGAEVKDKEGRAKSLRHLLSLSQLVGYI